MKRRIDKLVPVKNWFAAYHEENDRCTARLVPVHFMAITYEQWRVTYEETFPGAKADAPRHVTLVEDEHEVYGMVYDVVNADNGLSFAHEMHDFIALCEPGEVRERYWDDMAEERVNAERIVEEREAAAAARQAEDDDHGGGTVEADEAKSE